MKRIYLVTSGCYSDYCVEAVFTTKAKAEEYIKSVGERAVCCPDFNDIEEYELDAPITRSLTWYTVSLSPLLVGDWLCFIDYSKLNTGTAYIFKIKDTVQMLVCAETKDKARAIARERAAAWKAVKETHTPLYDEMNVQTSFTWLDNVVIGHVYDLNTFRDVSMEVVKGANIITGNELEQFMDKLK